MYSQWQLLKRDKNKLLKTFVVPRIKIRLKSFLNNSKSVLCTQGMQIICESIHTLNYTTIVDRKQKNYRSYSAALLEGYITFFLNR